MNITSLYKALLATLIAGATLGLAYADSCPMPAGQPQHPAKPMKPPVKGVQKVTVKVDSGFVPSTLNVKAGKPVQITFAVKNIGCANEVVFPGLKMTKKLKQGQNTVVTIVPKKAGAIAFQCGMGMYKGSIVAK